MKDDGCGGGDDDDSDDVCVLSGCDMGQHEGICTIEHFAGFFV